MESNKMPPENEATSPTKPSKGGYVECLRCGSIYLPTCAHKCTKERIAKKIHDDTTKHEVMNSLKIRLKKKQQKKARDKKVNIIIAVITIIPIYLVAINFYFYKNSVGTNQFKPYINDYLKYVDEIISDKSKGSQINIKGPILIIDKSLNDVARCFSEFPKDIVANTPNQVQTIITYEYKGVKVEAYYVFGYGDKAVSAGSGVHLWEETIVDIKTNSLILRKNITNSMPSKVEIYDIDFIKDGKADPDNYYKEIIIDGKSVITIKKEKVQIPCYYQYDNDNKGILDLAGYPRFLLYPNYRFSFNK